MVCEVWEAGMGQGGAGAVASVSLEVPEVWLGNHNHL